MMLTFGAPGFTLSVPQKQLNAEECPSCCRTKRQTLCPILVCFCLIHPSIIFCSSEVKSQRYQVQVGDPDIPLSRHTLHLITGDPKAFPG
ncbi:hypothetical protein AMECASPLE_009102 [Ameca splendens]|uniref:Uncharacterized protein n=1 Tax=Ameca splendens TaxID=208324 RepID=A0ABV0XP69_9TELE